MYIYEYCGKGFHSFCYPSLHSFVPSEFYYCSHCLSRISTLYSKDPILNIPLLTHLKTKTFPLNISIEESTYILTCRDLFFYENGTYYVKTKNVLCILPIIIARKQILHKFHNNFSHVDIHKTISLILTKYFWPSLRNDVRKYIAYCVLCIAKYADFRYSNSL